MPNRRRARRHVHVFVRDIFEQSDKIDLLLIITAEGSACLLPDNRDNRGMVHFRIVKSVEQMNRAGAGGGQTNTDFAGELGMPAGHECSHFLMPHLHVIHRVAGAVDRTDDAVNAVAGISVNATNAPLADSFDQKIACRLRHRSNQC